MHFLGDVCIVYAFGRKIEWKIPLNFLVRRIATVILVKKIRASSPVWYQWHGNTQRGKYTENQFLSSCFSKNFTSFGADDVVVHEMKSSNFD